MKMCQPGVRGFLTLIFSCWGNHWGARRKQFSPPCDFQNNNYNDKKKTVSHSLLWRTTPLPLKEMKWVVWRKCFGSQFSLGHCCEMVFVEWFSSEIRHSRNVLLLVFQLSEKKERVNKFTNELLIHHATLLNRRETNKGLSSVRINKAEPKIALQPVSRLNAAEFTVNNFAHIKLFGNWPIREMWPNLIPVSSWAWVRHAL